MATKYYYCYHANTKKFNRHRSVEKTANSTDIKPPTLKDDEVAIFDEQQMQWFVQADAVKQLALAKIAKIRSLEAAFKASKTVVIKNGHSLTITADDADRDFFIKNIEDSINSVNLKENFLEVLEYRQFTASKVFRVRAVAYLWRYVFGEYNKHRVANKLMYKTFKVAINNASTAEILDSITFKFADALVVDINDKVAEIEADKNTPEGVLKAINDAKDDKGIVHLVKDLTA